MNIVLIGSEGSMGKRYQAILDFLKVPHTDFDKFHHYVEIEEACNHCDGIIIATPTPTHAKFIYMLGKKGGPPILCEKPVTTNMNELEALLKFIEENEINFTMMNQYKLLDDPVSKGGSYYDFFRHGSDGLYWDCLQIVGLARGVVKLHEKSPFWRCMLNGKILSLDKMDGAYLTYVENWLKKPGQELWEIRKIHQKVADFIGSK